ncbi:hypothetical protein CL618_03190 [archaeon]|nr:hypothetical protein [archaeon]|tara:strand:+ start:3323 stop:4162 length:840 start_codon:yes stop_codon:yes gene_type:complete
MKRAIIYLIIFLLMLVNVSALIDINLDVKPEFQLNEMINFNYSITSDIDQSIQFYPHVICNTAPVSLLQQKQSNLIENEPFTERYYDFKIDNSIEPQTCTAYVQILSPIQKIVEKTFKIETSPSFEFDIELDKKVFTQGEDINLKYSLNTENPLIKATLTLPDKSTQQLTLPIMIKADQIGTYSLEVTASKQGYKTQTVKEQFAVIEKPAKIRSISVCNVDEICSEGENVKNCPQDCKAKREKVRLTKGPVLYSLLITIILIIILFLGFYFKRKREYNL